MGYTVFVSAISFSPFPSNNKLPLLLGHKLLENAFILQSAYVRNNAFSFCLQVFKRQYYFDYYSSSSYYNSSFNSFIIIIIIINYIARLMLIMGFILQINLL